jgi:tripartite-type tricarboxylate transporter receptor subunit TctC
MMHRRQVARLVLGALLGLAARFVAAESITAKPIRMLVGYPPGGQSDSIARLLARELGMVLNTTIIVDNRPGAKGLIAAEAVAHAPADGLTLLLPDRGVLIAAPAFETALRFDPERDFLHLARVALVPYMLVARTGLGLTSVSQLIAHARDNPGKLSFAFAGELTQIAIEILKESANIDVLPIPYKSAGQGALDLSAGRVDLLLADPAVIAPLGQSGAIRVLACTGQRRSTLYPDAPTMAASGFPDLVWYNWHSVAIPANAPKNVTAPLLEGLKVALATTAYRSGLARLGFEPVDETAAQFAAVLQSERKYFKGLADRLGRFGPK